MTDKVADAIAATETRTETDQVPVRVTLSTGRQVGLVVPVDMTSTEAVDLIGYVSVTLPQQLAERRESDAPRPRPVRLWAPPGARRT